MRDDPLSMTALRYAARDLPPVENAAFEVRLATDKSAQDALAEAVRLSAAALGRPVPGPMPGLRGLIADRLHPVTSAVATLFCRRAYHGHPAAWAGLGAIAASAAVTAGVWLGIPEPPGRPEFAAVACPTPVEAPPTVPVVTVVAPPAAPVDTEAAPLPTASAPLPMPMTPAPYSAIVPNPNDEKNPMTSAAGPDPMTGSADAPPAARPKTIPDPEPALLNPDDTFSRNEAVTGS